MGRSLNATEQNQSNEWRCVKMVHAVVLTALQIVGGHTNWQPAGNPMAYQSTINIYIQW